MFFLKYANCLDPIYNGYVWPAKASNLEYVQAQNADIISAVQQRITWWCKRTQEIKKLKLQNIVSNTTIEVKRKEYTICESFIIFPPTLTAQQEPTIVIENLICSIYVVHVYKSNWNLKKKTKLTSNSLSLIWWLCKLLDYIGSKIFCFLLFKQLLSI